KEALRLYVGSQRYQRALVVGAERVDLAGAPTGIVSAEVAAKAKASIELVIERRNQAAVAVQDEQDATKLRQTVSKASPATEAAPAADKLPIVEAPVPPVSGRPKLTL